MKSVLLFRNMLRNFSFRRQEVNETRIEKPVPTSPVQNDVVRLASDGGDSPRPMSEISETSVEVGNTGRRKRLKSPNDKQRPLTRYLPIKGSDLDLRQHIESAGFISVTDQTAMALKNNVLNLLSKHSILLNKCREQGYDGTAVISGKYKGLQALIRQQVPNADYIHCASHNLNLVLNYI